MLTDPIADLLTRIRNALQVRRMEVAAPCSRVKQGVAEALKREGFIRDYEVTAEGPQGTLKVYLKYGPQGEDVINVLRRVSRPGRRVFRGVDDLEAVLDGVGIRVVSTSKGVLSDRECREQRIGGEVLCEIW
jgi:small subunit ribosomal protein S8